MATFAKPAARGCVPAAPFATWPRSPAAKWPPTSFPGRADASRQVRQIFSRWCAWRPPTSAQSRGRAADGANVPTRGRKEGSRGKHACKSPSTAKLGKSPTASPWPACWKQLEARRQAGGGRGESGVGSAAAPRRAPPGGRATGWRLSLWWEEDERSRIPSMARRIHGSCKHRCDRFLRIGSHTFSSRLIVGTGKYARLRADERGPGHRRRRVHHRGRPPRAADRRAGQEPARLHRHPPLHDPSQHGRLLHGRRRGPRGPAGARNPLAD